MQQQQILSKPPSRISRDEMNLAEFPLTVLSTRANPRIKTLEFKDTVRKKNGECVNREWIITGADKFGLPTSSDEEVLLGLLKLTVDSDFRDRKVYFTRYELLKILRWTTEGRSYRRLQRALDRLSGVRIKATNAFFDNSAKAYSTVNFGIVDAYEINDGRDASGKDPAPSFFIWSEVLFDSFQDGYIKKLDLDFYLMLESAVSKRLYRYLDKHFWYKSSKKINVFVLAHEKLGISRNYRFLSSIRQQLDPAIEELTRLGFLSNAAYVGRGKDAEIILYAANGVPRSVSGGATSTNSGVPEVIGGVGGTSSGDRYPHYLQNNEETPSNYRPPQQEMELLSGEFDSVKAELAKKLVERGIRKNQVRNLIENRSLETLKRMVKIIAHYDYLIQSDSNLISRSPVGFLYRAIENSEEFFLPDDRKNHENKPHKEKKSPDTANNARQKLEGEYLVVRKKEIQRLKENVEASLLSGIRIEVEEALGRLKGLISEPRFKEAVELGVEEKLAKLFALPSFEEWSRNGLRQKVS